MKIKIFVDAHVFDNEFQGSRTFIKELYRELSQKEDMQLFIAAHNVENLKASFGERPNITYLRFSGTSGIKRLLFEIPSLIKKHGIDYAHFQYIVPPVKNCKYIDTIHDVIFNDYPAEFSLAYRLKKNVLYGFSAHRSDIITTVSGFSKQSIARFLKTGKKEIHVTPNGVSPDFYVPFNKVASQNYIREKYRLENYILYVSRFEPRKNHLLLLQAYIDLQLYAKGHYLVLLGHTSINIAEFDRLLNSLPPDIRRFIFISSEVNDQDLMEFYRGAAAFIYPSKAEGFGIPPLEAGALKIPVLCSNTSAMSDFSFFGDFHIDCSDRELFTQKLERILVQPPGQEELDKIAGEIARLYSWRESAEKLYQAILKNYICK